MCLFFFTLQSAVSGCTDRRWGGAAERLVQGREVLGNLVGAVCTTFPSHAEAALLFSVFSTAAPTCVSNGST